MCENFNLISSEINNNDNHGYNAKTDLEKMYLELVQTNLDNSKILSDSLTLIDYETKEFYKLKDKEKKKIKENENEENKVKIYDINMNNKRMNNQIIDEKEDKFNITHENSETRQNTKRKTEKKVIFLSNKNTKINPSNIITTHINKIIKIFDKNIRITFDIEKSELDRLCVKHQKGYKYEKIRKFFTTTIKELYYKIDE